MCVHVGVGVGGSRIDCTDRRYAVGITSNFHGVQIEMSSLTGEPRPVPMKVIPEDEHSVTDAHNVAFSSSLVIAGEGVGVVVRCVVEAMCCDTPATRLRAVRTAYRSLMIVGSVHAAAVLRIIP
jgi:hypothetical protein